MDLKLFFKALAYKARQRKPIVKKLAKSYVSLFLVFILGITSSYAWFAQRKTAQINANALEFKSASSLRINKEQNASNIITIDDVVLDEASSTDGRNIYFPLDKSFTTDADDMYFREGNAGDKNVRYVYEDFSLKGSSGNTPVYIKSYEIKVEAATPTDHDTDVNATYHDHLEIGYTNGKPSTQNLPPDHCPIRLAFIADSGQKPVVIDPSAQVVDYVDNTINAVNLIDDNGVPTTVDTFNNKNGWNSFSTYYYGNTPLFVIPGGQQIDVTLVVWLEGTLENSDKYIGKHISVDIDIESNFPEMDTITFYDASEPDNANGQQHWVSNDNPIIACAYEDPYSTETPKRWKTVIMSKVYTNEVTDPTQPGYVETYTWKCKIPRKAVTNIFFYRLSRSNSTVNAGDPSGTIYNAWYTSSDAMSWRNTNIDSWLTQGNLQSTRQYTADGNTYNALVYTAIHGNGYSVTTTTSQRLSPCVGYWDYSGGSGGGGSSGGGSGGGGSSSSTYNIQINVNDNTSAHWIQRNITYSQDKLYFSTANGSSGQLTQNGTNKFTWSGTLSANDEITSFYLTNSSGSTYRTWIPSRIFTVTSDYNISYYVNSSDQMMMQ